MVDKTLQLLLKAFEVMKAERRTKAQKQADKAKALRGRMASPRIQERISMEDLARLAGEAYTDLGDASTTPQGFGRALREGKQDLASAQDVSMDRRVANLADKREGEATERDRKKSARLQLVRRRNDEPPPPVPVNAFLKAFGVMKAKRGERKRLTYESRDNMLRIKRRQLNRGAPGYEGKTLADLDDHERRMQRALGNHDWEPPAHGETPQITRRLNAVEADWDRKRIAAERIGDRSWSRNLPQADRKEE